MRGIAKGRRARASLIRPSIPVILECSRGVKPPCCREHKKRDEQHIGLAPKRVALIRRWEKSNANKIGAALAQR